MRNLLLLAVLSLLMASCHTNGDEIPYMTNIDQIPSAALAAVTTQAGDFTIKPGDMFQQAILTLSGLSIKSSMCQDWEMETLI